MHGLSDTDAPAVDTVDIFRIKCDLDRSSTHAKFETIKDRNHDLPDLDSSLHVTETPALTTWSSETHPRGFVILSFYSMHVQSSYGHLTDDMHLLCVVTGIRTCSRTLGYARGSRVSHIGY